MNPQMVDQRVQQLDTNKDGSISAEEYRNGTLVQFDKLDTNHDGIVSAAEAGAANRRRPLAFHRSRSPSDWRAAPDRPIAGLPRGAIGNADSAGHCYLADG